MRPKLIRIVGTQWLPLHLFLLAGLSSCTVKPPPPNYEGRQITSLSIQYRGRPAIDEARLKNLISSKAGTRYSNERIAADVQSLYQSGLVEDVRFVAEPKGETIRLIAEVQTWQPGPSCTFIGNTAFTDQMLAKVSKLKPDKLTAKYIEAGRRNIEKFYRRHGYKDARITVKFGSEESGDFDFIITEGERVMNPKPRTEQPLRPTDKQS